MSYTIQPNMPISSMLKGRLEISVALGLQAMIAGTLVGLILGIFAAIKHNTVFDTGATVISALGISLPSYVFAIVLSYFIGYKARLFPMLYSSKAAISSIVLPTVALAMFPIATISRYTRSEMLDVLGSDYMLFAETKGINRWRIMILHGLRNAFIPILTVLGPMVVGLMMGSMVVENIFSIPGIGSLLVLAIQDNDYNVVLAITFICSDLYIVVNLFVDMLYCMIDPRIRLTKGSERNE